mgnify:FL=1
MKRELTHPEISQRILALKQKDDGVRNKLIRAGTLADGYHEEMQAIHNSNTGEIDTIMESIGYPTANKVGREASDAAWLIIQHSIGRPDVMKKSARLLEKAVREKIADPQKLAYLTNRIAVFEGRPQLYGTQFDWNEEGKMTPNQYDNLERVNQRRAAIGLNTLQEQTKLIQKRVEQENQHPPKDLAERNRAFDKWRRSVGWIT